MKGFIREDRWCSLCGLNCGLCPMNLEGRCPGCGGGAGNQSCALARCSLDHGGVAYCIQCGEYPCARYEGFDDSDSFISHLRRAADLEKLREVLKELSPEDREFILEYYEGENKFLDRMSEKYGLTRNQVIGRKRRILKQLKSRFFEDF